jgi:spore photoproduct lyase
MKSLHEIEKIYIDRAVISSEVAIRAREFYPAHKVEVVDVEPYSEVKGALSVRQFDRSKREIFITNFKGQFFKRCPGSRPGLTCCNYFVLNLGQQCNMNCSYCYLQSFINSPVMKIYANIDQALLELKMFAQDLGSQPLRVGTGEVIDSLSLDPLTLYSRKLITFFRDHPGWKLEFKTKSSCVEQFLDVEHAGNVIVSFSLNPQNVIDREEHGTASLEGRLLAARRARDRGFLLAFHLDPMIYHEGWERSYLEMVNEITTRFRPDEVQVMSVGALRFQPEQRHMMRERFGMQSFVMQAEVFPGRDGKLRYDQALREKMYSHLTQAFRAHSKEWKIFLCMESPETWLGSVGGLPKSQVGLGELFDHRVIQKFDQVREPRTEGQHP